MLVELSENRWKPSSARSLMSMCPGGNGGRSFWPHTRLPCAWHRPNRSRIHRYFAGHNDEEHFLILKKKVNYIIKSLKIF